MDFIRKTLRNLSDFWIERRQFFLDARAEIAESNLVVLQSVSFLALAMLAFFLIITPYIIEGWKITIHYILFIPVLVLFFLFAGVYEKQPVKSSRTIQWMCLLFFVAVIGFVMVIDIFPYPGDTATYFAICIAVLPVLFTLDLPVTITLVVISEIIYVCLTLAYKVPEKAHSDVYGSLVGFLFSFVLNWTVLKLRITDNAAKIKYRYLSTIDQLTGILNKGTCEQYVRDYLQLREPKNCCALMVIDIDDFKLVNDNYGHKTGDELLEAMGNSLLKIFRTTDVVGRFGGDEFLVFMKNLPDARIIQKKTERIQNAIKHLKSDHKELEITCSVGVAMTSERYVAFDELFQLADDALYEAKAFGKGRCILHRFDAQTLQACSKKRMLIVDDDAVSRQVLRFAFENDYSVVEASDGSEALSLLSQYRGEIAVILLDLIMPGIDGHAILKYLKSRSADKHIPVFVVTSDKEKGEDSREHGAVDVILKPIEPEIARLRVNNIMKKIRI